MSRSWLGGGNLSEERDAESANNRSSPAEVVGRIRGLCADMLSDSGKTLTLCGMVGQASVSTEWTSSDALSIGPAGLAQIRRGSVQQTDDLTVATVEEEVERADGFQPALPSIS